MIFMKMIVGCTLLCAVPDPVVAIVTPVVSDEELLASVDGEAVDNVLAAGTYAV